MDSIDKKVKKSTSKTLNSGCFNHHNDKKKCNSSRYNGKKCKHFPGGKYSAPRCSPINELKVVIGDKLKKKIKLTSDDVAKIQKIRDHDEKTFQVVSDNLKDKKSHIQEEREQLANLLRILYIEKENHKDALDDLEEKFKLLKSNHKKEKAKLKEHYRTKLKKFELDFSTRNSQIESNLQDDSISKQKNLKDYLTKIDQLKDTCIRENNRLIRSKINTEDQYHKMKKLLLKKQKETSQDKSDLTKQYKNVKNRLKILESDEKLLMDHIKNFKQSQDKYNKLVSSLESKQLSTQSQLDEIETWLESNKKDDSSDAKSEPDQQDSLAKYKRNVISDSSKDVHYDTTSEELDFNEILNR